MRPHWNKTATVKKAGCFLKIIFRQIDNYLLRFDKTNLNLEFPNCGGKDFFFFFFLQMPFQGHYTCLSRI